MATARSSPASRSAAATTHKKNSGKAGREPTAKPPAAPRDVVSHETPPREAVAARVHSMVARELDAVERVLDVLAPEGPGDAERAARTLASLARTLRELSLMNRGTELTGEGREATAAGDDDIPRDLDEFRRELARRIDAFIGDGADGGLPGSDGAGLEHVSRA